MRPNPSLADLLEIAREVVRQRLVPELSGQARYEALMAANAIAIAMRQIAAGADASGSAEEDRALAAEIRAGRHGPDSATHAEVYQRLLDAVTARVRESNPRYLERG